MEVHHHEVNQPVSALNTVADALPGLGIVAAVLGVVVTMGSLGGPPKKSGQSGAALVGRSSAFCCVTASSARWRRTWAK